jgi:hypothetical protein
VRAFILGELIKEDKIYLKREMLVLGNKMSIRLLRCLYPLLAVNKKPHFISAVL